MFDLTRANATKSAAQIEEAIYFAAREFIADGQQTGDITAVVVKTLQSF